AESSRTASQGGGARELFTELDTSTVDPRRAAIHVVEFFVWWEQAGRVYYTYTDDDGLKLFAHDAVKALGGWRAARRILRATIPHPSADAVREDVAQPIVSIRDKVSD